MSPLKPAVEAAEFRGELVRRFFNPKSYFFLCLSTRLQEIHESHSRLDEDDYLLIGALLDRLVQSEDKFEELQALSEIEGFQGFCNYLGDNVSRLRDPQLTQEGMKSTIESLAGTLAEMLASAVHNPNSREKLEKHLGIEITEQSSTRNQTPWPMDETLSEPFLTEVRAGLKAFGEAVNGTIDLEKMTSALEGIRVSAMIYGDDEVENIAEKTIQFISSTRGIAEPDQTLILHSKELMEQLLEDGKRDGLQKDVHAHIAALTAAVMAAKEQPPRAARRCKTSKSKPKTNGPHALVPPMDSFRKAEDRAPATQPVQEENLPLLDETKPVTAGSGVPEVTKVEKPVTELAGKEKEHEAVSLEEQVIQDATASPSDWKIPGEDDEELLALIEEVTRAQRRVRGKTDQEILVNDIGDSDAIESVSSLDRDSDPRPAIDRRNQSFYEEASLSIKVLGDALGTLMTQPEKRSAWEDVELAAHSLKGVAERLGLETLAQVPALMESLATRNFLKGSRASAVEMIPVLKRGVDFLKGLPQDNGKNSEQLQKLIEELKHFAVTVDRAPNPMGDESRSPKKGRFPLRPTALFRLRRREGDHPRYLLDERRSAEEAS